MQWLGKIRRDWRNYSREHRRLLRRQRDRSEYHSLTSLLQSEHMTMQLWGTPQAAAVLDNGWLHRIIRENGDRLLVETRTTEGFAAQRTDAGVVGVYMNFTGPRSVEVVVGLAEDQCYREFIWTYFRDSMRDYERAGEDGELTFEDDDGTLAIFGLVPTATDGNVHVPSVPQHQQTAP